MLDHGLVVEVRRARTGIFADGRPAVLVLRVRLWTVVTFQLDHRLVVEVSRAGTGVVADDRPALYLWAVVPLPALPGGTNAARRRAHSKE